jgi:hypothetical protein
LESGVSYLEELRNRLVEQQSQKDADLSKSQMMLESTRQILVPTMRELYSSLSELRQLLDQLKPRLKTDYELQDISTFRHLEQGHYMLWSNPGEEDEKFVFQYSYSRPGSFSYRLARKDDADRLREWLWLHGFRFESLDMANSVFSINYHVPVSYEFSAALDKSAIQLRMRNVGAVGTITSLLNPDSINKALVDELAKLVMHEPNEFNALTGNALTDSQREWIKAQVEEEWQSRGTPGVSEMTGKSSGTHETSLSSLTRAWSTAAAKMLHR